MAAQPTVELCWLAKQAVQTLFEKQRKQQCRSPERPDLPLSQEEASGFLCAAALGVELLPTEARALGKRVENDCLVLRVFRG